MNRIDNVLNDFPRANLSIVDKTPVQRLFNIEKLLNTDVKIYIKRDDMLRPYFGNKLRYLEYIVGHYKSEKFDSIIHAGGTNSNYMGQLAMIGAIEDIPIHIILNKRPDTLQGNPLIEKLFGANLYFSDKKNDNTNSLPKEKLRKKLVSNGQKPYVIDYPEGNYFAYLGYMRAFNEIISQQANFDIDHIYLCSWHHTHMGLEFGKHLLGSKINIVPISPTYWADFAHFESYRHFLSEKVIEFSSFMKIKFNIEEKGLIDEFVGKGYGIPSNGSLEAMSIMAKYEGIILDPIYTGKAFYGLMEHIKSGKINNQDSVLFIHTGGVFNLFQYNQEISDYIY